MLLAGRSVNILKQKADFRKFKLAGRSHAEYAEVAYQENDGFQVLVRFRSPEQQKAQDAIRTKETAAEKAQVAKNAKVTLESKP
ncbi:MAG: hypothetical protein KGL39_33600 [Patescibacteria group bacterium]|nr:hypothetical protein [Patescibacteria group bacterium]